MTNALPPGNDTHKLMVDAIKAVEAVLPGYGVALVVFTLGQVGSTCNYIGNCDRGEMPAALGEVLARWKRGAN